MTLAWKKGEPPGDALRALAGEFANEILSCAWRAQITQENRGIIEAVTSKALAGAMGPPTLEDLAKFDFSDDALDDPLGIAMSWEEKYGKKKGPASVRTLRFHVDMYGGPALDEAVAVYAPFADLVRGEEPPHWVVTVSSVDEARERRIAGELANYALGLTVKQRSAAARPSGDDKV